MKWHMEIIDARERGAKTGKGAAYTTEAECRAAFERARPLARKGRAEFLLDLHNDNGDLLDTIQIDAAGFEALTGEPPMSAEYYTQWDADYWRRAMAAYRANPDGGM